MPLNVNFIIYLYSVHAICHLLASVLLMSARTWGIFFSLFFSASHSSFLIRLNSVSTRWMGNNTRSMRLGDCRPLFINITYTRAFPFPFYRSVTRIRLFIGGLFLPRPGTGGSTTSQAASRKCSIKQKLEPQFWKPHLPSFFPINMRTGTAGLQIQSRSLEVKLRAEDSARLTAEQQNK